DRAQPLDDGDRAIDRQARGQQHIAQRLHTVDARQHEVLLWTDRGLERIEARAHPQLLLRRPDAGDLGRYGAHARDRIMTCSSSTLPTCSRFSAWTQASERGPSSTSPVISSPRCAGKQCNTIALAAARETIAASMQYPANAWRRRSASSSCPIDDQTSVDSTCAPVAACCGSVVSEIDPLPSRRCVSRAAATMP